jgi:beta-lactamase regulating signal transducer with metallopeptidase domain
MNAFVQTLNTAGRAFIGSAVPMLIQSSLLILILLAIDAVLRKRVRAVFRYWIWMLVLVKLVLPPSLWSPVSVGTWFGDTLEVPTVVLLEAPQLLSPEEQGQDALATRLSPAVGNFLSQPQPMTVVPPLPEPTVAPPVPAPAPVADQPAPIDRPPAFSLNWQGLVLLVWAGVVAALLLLLAQRTFFVRGLVAQAEEASRALLNELDRCRQQLGLRKPVSARLSPNATSPAVCGLWRPVILIPQGLAARLRGTDLHAVLFHELAHVRRGDLWSNLAQTILQILYFYNPLLWLANAAIRHIREQAVDETVLVAMGESAPQYPDTLINVAKLALARRPALSLRLIGVVESQSALTSRIKHILNRPLPKTARLGLLGLVIVSMSAAVLLPMAQAAQESVSVTSDGPLDIRLVGIRPDEGDDLYDAEGKKLETPLGFFGTGSPVWNEDEQRRDFIFRVPAVQGQLLFPQAPPLRAAGTNYRQGGGFNIVFDPAGSPSTLVVSCTFPRTYRRSWSGLLHLESSIRQVDLTLQYFYGARREALCTFTGPFVEGKALAADEGRPYLLTPQKPPDGGSNSHIRFTFTTSQPFDSSVPVLLYDREGRRHLARDLDGSSGTGGTHLTYNVQTDWWDQITAITVGEKPQEITFRNLAVEYPNRPQRTYAAHLDRMAERLGLTGLSREQLAQYRFKNAQEALAVLDVLRDGGQIQNATDAIFPNHLPVDFAALDAATRDRIRTAALSWLQSPSVGLRACGVELGLRAGYREFVDPAFALLDYRHPTAAASIDLYRVALGLRQYRDSLTPADIERLRQLALGCDSGRVWSMVFEYCLRSWRRPEVSEVLWELAQEERPWLWWAALKALSVHGDERLKMYAALPEKMKLRVILTNRREQPGQAELLPKARRLLSGLFTPQTVLMHPQTGSDLRLVLTTFLDRRETTAVYMDFLAAVLQPATHLEAEHSFDGTINSIVSDLIRDLNAWYGVNLGELGTYQPGKINASIRSSSELVKAVTAALDWYRTAETPQPVEPVLAGRVVDAKGRSIEGATVTLTEWWDSVDESGRQQQQRVPLGTIRTEADGRFVFRNLAAGRSHDLDVEAEGFTKRERMRVDRLPYRRYLVDRSEENNTIVLERSTSLSGRVIGLDGRPAAYVIVQVQSYPAYAEPQPNATTTDAQGRFNAGPVMSGYHVVRWLEGDEVYVRRGYERVKTLQVVHVEEGEAVENVTLDLREATAGLELQVVDDAGQPAPLSYVSLDIALPSEEEEYMPAMFLSLPGTEPRSLYQFSNLPPLDGYLEVTAIGQPARRIPIKLVAGQTARCKVDLSRPEPLTPVRQPNAAPSEGQRATAAEGRTSPPDFTAVLPDGVTVELLGACDYPSEGKQWWRPDGSPLAEAPYDKRGAWVFPNEWDKAPFELALRVRNLPENWEAAISTPDNAWSNAADPPYKAGRRLPELRWLMMEAEPNQTTCTIRCNLAAPWQTVARSSLPLAPSQPTPGDGVVFSEVREGFGGGRVTVSGRDSSGEGVSATVTGRVGGRDDGWLFGVGGLQRIVAITKDGKTQQAPSDGFYFTEAVGRATAYFPRLSLANVKEFQFQTRALTWVEFRNVPLRRDLKTDVTVDVRSADMGANVASPAGTDQEKEIVLPDVDLHSQMLDLATARLLPVPTGSPEEIWGAVEKLGQGDLVYDSSKLVLVRRAASPQAHPGPVAPFQTYDIKAPLPVVLSVTTAEGRRYQITILADADKACTLKYSPILTDKGAGGGALAVPEKAASTLELRIAPRRGELGPDAVEEFTKALAEGRSLADSRCLWAAVRPGMNLSPDLLTRTHQGKTWLLVYNDTSLIMVPSQGRRLVHVGRSTDENGRPMLVLRFDEAGAAQMVRLSRVHAGQLLAIIIGGVAVSTPTIPKRQEGVHCATVTGEFTEQALEDMTTTLRRGMAEPSANNGGAFRPVKLRNGVTVELLGVCEHPSVGKQWWRPDGSPLTERPYNDDDGRAFPNPGEKGYKLAVRFSGLAGKDVGAHAMPSDSQSTNGGTLDQISGKNGKQNAEYPDGALDQEIVSQGVAFDQELDSFDLTVGVSRGPWKREYWQEIGKSSETVEWAIFKDVTLRPQRRTEADKGAGGGALAAPSKDVDILGFRIAPTPEEVRSEVVEKYKRALTGGGGPSSGDFAWFEVRPDTTGVPYQITCEYDGKTYVLLWNDQSHVMRADGTWGLEDVRETADEMGQRAIILTFDAKGVQLLHDL